MTTETQTAGALGQAAGSLSRALAQRITRRSAVSRIGRYGVAVSMGAAGAALFDPEVALAAYPCGCGSCAPGGGGGCSAGKCYYDSRWCDYGGNCPPNTCRCGAWSAGCGCVGSNGARGTWYYGDCCGNCGGGNCNCSNSYDCSGGPCGGGRTGYPCPSCCHQLEHYGDPNRECGTCNCSSPWYVNCRRALCHT